MLFMFNCSQNTQKKRYVEHFYCGQGHKKSLLTVVNAPHPHSRSIEDIHLRRCRSTVLPVMVDPVHRPSLWLRLSIKYTIIKVHQVSTTKINA